MSVEDIERNIRNQQTQQLNQTPTKLNASGRSQTPQLLSQRPPQQQNLQQPPPSVIPNNILMHQQVQRIAVPPPGMQPIPLPKGLNGPNGPPNFAPPHHQISSPKQPMRLPPGFPPMQLMGPHGMAGGPMPHPANMPRPMPHNLPVALNNFAVSIYKNIITDYLFHDRFANLVSFHS